MTSTNLCPLTVSIDMENEDFLTTMNNAAVEKKSVWITREWGRYSKRGRMLLKELRL